ncbi:MAG: hypothetical protein IT160_02845 [Bryobacterales bacterium]|nr:hypothetical protein [Bryobacterales bacterium]
MSRILLLFLVFPLFAATIKVGTFPEEFKHSFTTAQGLPDNQVNCVATAGNRIYAGTAKGLAMLDGGNTWRAVSGLSEHPVELCASSGTALYLTYNGGLYRADAEAAKRLATLPDATPSALAADKSGAVLAAGRALYRLHMGKLAPIPGSPMAARQLALGPRGELAVAAEEGVFQRSAGGDWTHLIPHAGDHSWAALDSRGVIYDSQGRLWVATPPGVARLDGANWTLFTGREGLPYGGINTIALGEPGVIWFGTTRGAIRYDGQTWEYRQGLRWLPADNIRSIAVTSTGDAWFATSAGAGRIERKPTTLAEKARYFEDEIDKRHRRTPYGYVMAVQLPKAGDKSEWVQHDSDNDGLWTAMYGAGECFGYAATRDPLARARARKAFEALRFLSEVTQGGEHPAPPGFPARSILPTSGPDPNIGDSRERDINRRANHDHLWKILSPRWPKSADGKWYWKTDTSSDELDGHYFFYAQYYDLVAETPQEKEDVRKVVRAITDHLLAHDFKLVDWDGTPTRWGIFDPENLNHNRAFWAGRGLNSLSILSYLKVAEHMTGDVRYRQAYDKLVKQDSYATNAMVAKISAGPGSGNQSDDEMAFMSYYNLIKYETDDDLLQKYSYSLFNYWNAERAEMNPFFNFVAAASLEGKKFTSAFRTQNLSLHGDWLEDSVDTLRRLPLDRIDWRHDNSHRVDLIPVRSFIPEDDNRRQGLAYRRNGKVIPVDECFFEFWNHNLYRLVTGGGGHALGDGAVFLLPYYMGLYHRYIE